MGSVGLLFANLAKFSSEEYREYVHFDCPVPENANLVYSVSDTLPDVKYVKLEIDDFVKKN